MTGYITFCAKQLDSASLLQELTETNTAFRELVRKCQNNYMTKGMPLSSFLIKPMQRITKYPLLISKIIENTPENHPGTPTPPPPSGNLPSWLIPSIRFQTSRRSPTDIRKVLKLRQRKHPTERNPRATGLVAAIRPKRPKSGVQQQHQQTRP